MEDCYHQACANPPAWTGIRAYRKTASSTKPSDWVEEQVLSCADHRQGLYRSKRVRCEQCDAVLTGRQKRWCSKVCWALGNRKVGWFWRMLHDKQAGLCGICALPLNIPSEWMAYEPDKAGLVYTSPFHPCEPHKKLVEVDHVVPVARGGKYELVNLRVAHRKCNQGKKAKDLAFYRWQIGAYAEVIEERLRNTDEQVHAMLAEPRVSEGDYQTTGRHVMEGQGRFL